MPGQLRISHLIIVLGVGLAHVFLIILLSRHKPVGAVPPKLDIIPVMVVLPPPIKEKPPADRARQKPLKPLIKKPPAGKSPRQKPKLQSKDTDQHQNKDTGSPNAKRAINLSSPTRRTGAFIVRWGSAPSGAFGIFYRGFDCLRLNPVFNHSSCPSDPIDLMQGKQAKIAAVSGRMARMAAGMGQRGRIMGIDRAVPGRRRPLSTRPPTGAAIIDENFAKIPPKYPDPAFGD